MITVILADDHVIVRDTLHRFLETADDIRVMAVASNGKEAVTQAILYCPAVAIIDVSMPVMDGIQAASQIAVQRPQTKILMISMYNTPEHIQHCLKAGALGYVLKDMASKDLVPAIRTVSKGKYYFSDHIGKIARNFI